MTFGPSCIMNLRCDGSRKSSKFPGGPRDRMLKNACQHCLDKISPFHVSHERKLMQPIPFTNKINVNNEGHVLITAT
jgi:hypothetical protein